MTYSLRKSITALTIAGAVLLGASAPAFAAKSLYQRLGGYDAIAAVVDDFFGRLMADKLNARFFNDVSDDRKTQARQFTVDFICKAAGGPCKYNGRDMLKTHKGMGITKADWNASVVHLKATLAKFKVPAKEQKDVLGFIGSLKGNVVDK